MKGLIGRTEMEDVLKRLDKPTQEDVCMATAQNLRVTHTVVNTVAAIDDPVSSVDNKVADVIAASSA